MKKPKILFVCLGNICRSPMAEYILRRRAAEAGIPLEADSAGDIGLARRRRYAPRDGKDIEKTRYRCFRLYQPQNPPKRCGGV